LLYGCVFGFFFTLDSSRTPANGTSGADPSSEAKWFEEGTPIPASAENGVGLESAIAFHSGEGLLGMGNDSAGAGASTLVNSPITLLYRVNDGPSTVILCIAEIDIPANGSNGVIPRLAKAAASSLVVFNYLLYPIISSRGATERLSADVFCNVMHPTIAKGNGGTSHQLYKTAGVVIVKVGAQNRPEICITSAAQEIEDDACIFATSAVD
jgi:hypothetical protein